jgi:hypothetical protein
MKDIIGWLLRLNITDDFKKFFKWLVIIIIVLFLLLIIWFVGYISVDKYNDSKVAMIALECDWTKTYKEWYLILKKRGHYEPHGLYQGRHVKAVVGDEKIYLERSFEVATDKFYYFGTSESRKHKNWGYRIDRNNLETTFYNPKSETLSTICKEISESEFYRNVEREIKIKKDSVKF